MTLPSSGQISLSDVNTELQLSSTTSISLNDANVRALFGKPSGAISLSDGYGKSLVKLTVGNSGTSVYGFSLNLGFGSISPTNLNGATILALYDYIPSSHSLYVVLSGSLPQSFFASVTINGVVFMTSSATYQTGATTQWAWPTANFGIDNPGSVYPCYFA